MMEGSGSIQINYGSGFVILTNRSGSGRPKIKKVEFSCEVVWRNKLKESLSIGSTCASTPPLYLKSTSGGYVQHLVSILFLPFRRFNADIQKKTYCFLSIVDRQVFCYNYPLFVSYICIVLVIITIALAIFYIKALHITKLLC